MSCVLPLPSPELALALDLGLISAQEELGQVAGIKASWNSGVLMQPGLLQFGFTLGCSCYWETAVNLQLAE